jgi:hypothetical protein
MLIEFSATFGQVAEAEATFGRYAKAIMLDYAYDRFHADLYGKDFWNVKLDGHDETTEPRRVCRRLIWVGYAAMASVSRAA